MNCSSYYVRAGPGPTVPYCIGTVRSIYGREEFLVMYCRFYYKYIDVGRVGLSVGINTCTCTGMKSDDDDDTVHVDLIHDM